jgi:N-acetylated-alpha-linked acidic dipeptidase
MVAVEEMARSVGALLKTGWRPERTIIIAGWDGEEWGLLGSTEWAEKYATELKANAVAYINSDSNNRGWLSAAGSHSLELFAREVARDVTDPKTQKSVLDALEDRLRELRRSNPQGDSAFTLAALGSGSDYTAFLDHVGLASLNLSYGGDANAGIYHSIYDTFDHYTRFMDTTFTYGVAEAQTLTTTALRLASAPVLPFEFQNVVRTYTRYVDEIERGARASDVTRSLDLTAVRQALSSVQTAAQRWETAYARVAALTEAQIRRNTRQLAELNRTLYQTERALTHDAGLPEREWFRHLIYAPGFYTGYGVKTMPGIREAVEDVPDAAVAQREAARVATALEQYAARIEQAALALEQLR